MQNLIPLHSSYFKSIIVLATGTALSQLIPVLASPAITRLYSPENFGLFAVFSAIVMSMAPAIMGTYELAIVLPKKNKVAYEVAGISFLSGIFIGFFCFLIFFIFDELLLKIIGASELKEYLLLAPVVMFLIGFFNIGNYLANRTKNYQLMSRAKVWQASSMVFITLILGFMETGFTGLIVGSIVGYLIASIFLMFANNIYASRISFSLSKRKLLIAKKYADYPIFNGSTALLNGITVALPVYFLSARFPEAIVGYFALVTRVVNLPLLFLSQAVFQVYLKRMVDEIHNNGNIVRLLNKTFMGLILFALLPTIILLIWAPELFSFIFGDNWLIAGEFTQIMVLALAFRFIVSTLSATYMATKNVKYASIRRVISFVFVVTALWISSFYEQAIVVIVLLSISMLLEDVIALLLIYRSALNPKLIRS